MVQFIAVSVLRLAGCRSSRTWATACRGVVLALLALGGMAPTQAANPPLKGTISIAGSSTVAPITTAMAEKFNETNKSVRIPVGTQGTGGGFKLFCAGETDINDASRPISDAEKSLCKEKGVAYLELMIAIDGITVVVNKSNDWCKTLTTDQLKAMWLTGSTAKNWSDIDPKWPNKPLKLFGPGTASGTFDYFCEEVLKKKGASRADYQQSEDDNVLVQGVVGDKFALGYFGYAYFKENKEKFRAVAIANGAEGKPVMPTDETIENGSYKPLSRPLFLYINKKSLTRPEVQAFVKFYLSKESQPLVSEVGYINLDQDKLKASQDQLTEALK